ncbi:hypothetical protein SFRURICE_013831 [Spodoptera frugiperda]|nr:hypothetical protein SFRURICE_013831 [Spodoptera frugiperda]
MGGEACACAPTPPRLLPEPEPDHLYDHHSSEEELEVFHQQLPAHQLACSVVTPCLCSVTLSLLYSESWYTQIVPINVDRYQIIIIAVNVDTTLLFHKVEERCVTCGCGVQVINGALRGAGATGAGAGAEGPSAGTGAAESRRRGASSPPPAAPEKRKWPAQPYLDPDNDEHTPRPASSDDDDTKVETPVRFRTSPPLEALKPRRGGGEGGRGSRRVACARVVVRAAGGRRVSAAPAPATAAAAPPSPRA